MLQLEALQLRQGDFALFADLSLAPGGAVAVLGPSGAGKSTLLSAIGGFLPPESGRLLWRSQDLAGLSPGNRPVSILFQDQNLFPHLTVEQNVALGIAPNLRVSEADRARVRDVLSRVGLAELGSRRPAALSGGQQSRAALARALVRDRPVALLDEPFSALGPALRAEMLELVATTLMGPESLVIFVTHDPADAAQIADRALVVADGRVSGPFKTGALLADPPPSLARYLRR